MEANDEARGVAIAGAALVLALVLYVARGDNKEKRSQKHWDAVCRRVLQERDNVTHRVLQDGSDTPQVRWIRYPAGDMHNTHVSRLVLIRLRALPGCE